MRIAAISDLHGNLAALATAIETAQAEDADEIWLLGDLIGRGDTAGVIALARETATLVVLGNHDAALADIYGEVFADAHNPALLAEIRETLDQDALNWLRGQPAGCRRHGIEAVHATLHNPLAIISSGYDAEAQLALADERLLLVGHHHRAFVYLPSSGWLDLPAAGHVVALPADEQALICPGAATPGSDGSPGSLLIIDLGDGAVEWFAVRPRVT